MSAAASPIHTTQEKEPHHTMTNHTNYPALRARRVATGVYNVIDDGGNVIAHVVKTGTHLDDYPWEHYFEPRAAWHFRGGSGTTQTKREALDTVSSIWAQRPGGAVSA